MAKGKGCCEVRCTSTKQRCPRSCVRYSNHLVLVLVRWPIWSQRFKRFRLAEKLHNEDGDIQVSSLLYAMGDESETIFNTFALTDAEQNDFYSVMSSVNTGREDRLAAGLGLTYNVVMKLMSP